MIALSLIFACVGCQSQTSDKSQPVGQNLAETESHPPELAEAEPSVADLEPESVANDDDVPRAATPVSRKVEVLIKSREFKAEGTQQALRVTFDDLDLRKVLNMDPVTPDAKEQFPAWLSGLEGKLIRIRGFMMPTFETSGIKQFVLTRDIGLIDFGRNPKVYELIVVELKPDTTCDYIQNRPFDVIGKLQIKMEVEDGKPVGLYWIEDAEIVQQPLR